MIRHIVLLKFKDSVSEADKQSIYHDLASLKDHVDGIRAFHAGPNVSVETEMMRGFNDAFWFDFDSAAVRDAYLVDPHHQAAGARIVAHTKGGPDGVIVVDLEF
ncbi:stress responsive alpha/beta barrel protein [Rhizobium sp. PP-F2F-G36]|nr:stress responsive alpha/beta barrel protein [Rhizobium sp. PP-CC-2G-626]TCQ02347.1 stress responsive alpha/beta barrel protein [Rhizobium sp. PP-F2F-G36]